MADGPIWIDEATVAASVGLGDAIDAVRATLRAQASGTAVPMPKAVLPISTGGSLHALGGEMTELGFIGTKTWCHTPGGAQPLLILYSPQDGSVRAVIEAFALGQLRTSATSAVATDVLARADADVFALIGTGKQAWAQAAAVAAVRPLREVRVFGRDADRRAAMVARIRATLHVATHAAGSVAEAVRGAGIVTLATRATAPILDVGDVEPGTHVNAIGAVTPERREFDPQLLARSAVVAADSVEQARTLSSELREFFGDDDAGWRTVRRLCDLVAGDRARPGDADVTVFKALGLGLSDIGVGVLALTRAQATAAVRQLPPYRHAALPATAPIHEVHP